MLDGVIVKCWHNLRNWIWRDSAGKRPGGHKNVALIYPAKRSMGCWPALGLAYIAAMLEKDGHSVKIVDRNPVMLKNEDVDLFTKNALLDFQPDIIGITATTPLMEDVVSVLALLGENFPAIQVVMGGPHVTALPEETLKNYPEVDIVARGEGEYSMTEIVAGCSLSEIAGITWRNNGEIQSNPPRPLISNLDELPLPARHLYDMEFYLQPENPVIRGVRGVRASHIYNARGCYYRCKFCAGSAVFGRKVRSHSCEKIIGEINHLINKYGVEALYFDEDVFFSSRERAETICKALIEEGIPEKIKWAGLMRANSAPLDILKMMRKAGCIQVEYGFETGSVRMLKEVHKGVTMEQNYEAARHTHKAGMRLLASMIVGCPSETEAEFDETVEFLRNIEPHYIGFNKFVPLPGSQYYKDLLEKGKLVGNHDWGLFHVGGSFPEQESISYSKVDGEEFFNKFCENEQGFIRSSNLVGTIISIFNVCEEKKYGFDFSMIKPQLFFMDVPEAEKAEADRLWDDALLCMLSDLDVSLPEGFFQRFNLSTEARVALCNNLGVHLMSDFRLKQAALFLDLTRKEAKSSVVLSNLGVLAFRRKEFVKADEFFAAALNEVGEMRKSILWCYANTVLLSGRLDKACDMYEAFDHEFGFTDGEMGLAACHILQGDFDKATTCWERVSCKNNLFAAKQNIKAKIALESSGESIKGYQSIGDFFY